MKNFALTTILFLALSLSSANSQVNLTFTFNWEEAPEEVQFEGQNYKKWDFNGAVFSESAPGVPFFNHVFPTSRLGTAQVTIIDAVYEPFPEAAQLYESAIGEALNFEAAAYQNMKGQIQGRLGFVPIVKRTGRFERLKELSVRVAFTTSTSVSKRGNNTTTSKLADGTIYKLAVNNTGMHRLSYSFLKEELGVDIDNIDPRNLQILGNGGGRVPFDTEELRIDDLDENPILVVGEEDGIFNTDDYILFYAEGPNIWKFDAANRIFNKEQNIYSSQNFYFLKVASTRARRISDRGSLTGTAYTSNTFDDFASFEEDKANLLHDWNRAQGSGQIWYGDHFKNRREYSYPALFTFENLDFSEPVQVKVRALLRAAVSSSFDLQVNNQSFSSRNVSRVFPLSGPNDAEVTYGYPAIIEEAITVDRNALDFVVSYPFPQGQGDGSEGWLDYIQVNVRRQLEMVGDELSFRDVRSLDFPSSSFQLGNANSNTRVWDITVPAQPQGQAFDFNGNILEFGYNSETLRHFIAFQVDGSSFAQPEAIGNIANQNIHGIQDADMAIVYHPEFESEASRLAEHRQRFSGLQVALVNVEHIYNEFSSGRLDPTAIRDFAQMLHEQSSNFRFLLLFGDGSFDHKDFYNLGGNFIPVFETESMNPINTYPTDDYFVIFDASTRRASNDPLSGDLELGIGRLPAQNISQAKVLVDKIINYETNPNTFQEWRNKIVMVGDDEDGNTHTGDADDIAEKIDRLYPSYNIEKIYLDAFPQVSTPGGTRYPEVTAALNQAIFKGILSVTYLGHGGSQGWAQERVLNISDILNWENDEALPLFITATCSFAGYDDPAFTTAGEEVLLNPRGGAIALFTTVRAVFANQNRQLTEAIMETLFDDQGGEVITLGEAMTVTKNSFASTFTIRNSRKFTLLGDPSMKLAIPRLNIVTERINDNPVTENTIDTIGALQQVTVVGYIANQAGQPDEDFNGIIYPTVFDKPIESKTLGQDVGSPVFDFSLQKNILFKGRASVRNGRFDFTFVVPRDINYQLGIGKISYYAADLSKKIDAGGFSENIAIGGTAQDGLVDNQGPRVEVFVNTEDFVFGGITDESPNLLVKLEDDNGINVVGNSIGHDLEGTLDEDTQNTILLNDFYQAELDDYTKGTVRYPLENLAEGQHSIRVKAWDVANNSAEGYTEFIVASSEGLALQHVLNYPNPFTDRTCFQFDHNIENIDLDVQINIYTVSGRLVKQIQTSIFSDGALRQDDCIEWDGRDDYGGRLARGVYLYKVKVRALNTGSETLSSESEFEKLVLLK